MAFFKNWFRGNENPRAEAPAAEQVIEQEIEVDEVTQREIDVLNARIEANEKLIGGLGRAAMEDDNFMGSLSGEERQKLYAPKEIGRMRVGAEDAWAFEPASRGLRAKDALLKVLGGGSDYVLESGGKKFDKRKLKPEVKEHIGRGEKVVMDTSESEAAAEKLGLRSEGTSQQDLRKTYGEGRAGVESIILGETNQQEKAQVAGQVLFERVNKLESGVGLDPVGDKDLITGPALLEEKKRLREFSLEKEKKFKEFDLENGNKLQGFREEIEVWRNQFVEERIRELEQELLTKKGIIAEKKQELERSLVEEEQKLNEGLADKEKKLREGLDVVRSPLQVQKEELEKSLAESVELSLMTVAQEAAYRAEIKGLDDNLKKMARTEQKAKEVADFFKDDAEAWREQKKQAETNLNKYKERKNKLRSTIAELKSNKAEIDKMLERLDKVGKTSTELRAEREEEAKRKEAAKQQQPAQTAAPAASAPSTVSGATAEDTTASSAEAWAKSGRLARSFDTDVVSAEESEASRDSSDADTDDEVLWQKSMKAADEAYEEQRARMLNDTSQRLKRYTEQAGQPTVERQLKAEREAAPATEQPLAAPAGESVAARPEIAPEQEVKEAPVRDWLNSLFKERLAGKADKIMRKKFNIKKNSDFNRIMTRQDAKEAFAYFLCDLKGWETHQALPEAERRFSNIKKPGDRRGRPAENATPTVSVESQEDANQAPESTPEPSPAGGQADVEPTGEDIMPGLADEFGRVVARDWDRNVSGGTLDSKTPISATDDSVKQPPIAPTVESPRADGQADVEPAGEAKLNSLEALNQVPTPDEGKGKGRAGKNRKEFPEDKPGAGRRPRVESGRRQNRKGDVRGGADAAATEVTPRKRAGEPLKPAFTDKPSNGLSAEVKAALDELAGNPKTTKEKGETIPKVSHSQWAELLDLKANTPEEKRALKKFFRPSPETLTKLAEAWMNFRKETNTLPARISLKQAEERIALELRAKAVIKKVE